jgi:DNA-binding transcriptional regulator LsrR (DeoR family)
METVLAIREKYSKGEKQQVLADEYGLSQAYVSNLVNHKFRNKIKNPTE